MNRVVVMAALRHLLGALGAVLAAKGISTEGEIETITGAVMTVVAFVFSVVEKRNRLPDPPSGNTESPKS